MGTENLLGSIKILYHGYPLTSTCRLIKLEVTIVTLNTIKMERLIANE